MDLADLIEPDRVVFAARASNKQQLLQDLASRAATLLNLDAQTIFAALQAREELGSTGLGNGFALPHARIEGLDRLFGMFVRLNRPVHFDSIDGNPVDLVFLLLIPPAAGSEHLAALASYLEVPARQGIRREIAQSAKRCRTVQPTLRSPAFVIFERLSYNATPPPSAAQSRARMCRDRCEIELRDGRHIVLDFHSATERRSYFAVHST